MATAAEKYFKTKFKKDIAIDDKHCKDYTNKNGVKTEDVAFTIHLPFEQLKSWYENKNSVLENYSYLQVLNEFIGNAYPVRVNENCFRIEERLRVICTNVVKQFHGKNGRQRHSLLTKVKDLAVYKSELNTVALVSDLERKVSHLESVNASIIQEKRLLELKYKETSTLISEIHSKISKATVDISRLKEENNSLYSIIEKLSPQRRFEDKGRSILEVGKRQQDRKLKTLQTRIDQALWFSESFGLQLDTVKLVDESGNTHTLSFGAFVSLQSLYTYFLADHDRIGLALRGKSIFRPTPCSLKWYHQSQGSIVSRLKSSFSYKK